MSKKKDGSFSADVNLPKDSKHEFKYLINQSEWLNDPEADKHQVNTVGGTNSVIILEQAIYSGLEHYSWPGFIPCAYDFFLAKHKAKKKELSGKERSGLLVGRQQEL